MLLTRRPRFEVRMVRLLRADLEARGWSREDAEAHALAAHGLALRYIRRVWNALAEDLPDGTSRRILKKLMWPAYRRAYRMMRSSVRKAETH